MTLEEIKLGYLRLDWESKVNVLRARLKSLVRDIADRYTPISYRCLI